MNIFRRLANYAKSAVKAIKSIFFYDNSRTEDLMTALLNNDTSNIKQLIERADVNVKSQGVTPLLLASVNGQMEAVKLLLEKGAKIDTADQYGNGALMFAVRQGHAEVAKLLFEKGAKINLELHGADALRLAAKHGHTDIVKLLLDKGVEIDSENIGETALTLAAKNGHIDTVKLLIENKAGIYTEWGSRSDALRLAAGNGHIDTVNLLIENGADVNAHGRRNTGHSTLLFAARNGHIDMVKLLIEKGACFNEVDLIGGGPFVYQHAEIVKLLLEKRVVDLPQGALRYVAHHGYVETAEILLAHGANIHELNRDGNTPLMIAASKGNIEMMNLLLAKGADVHTKNHDGKTALDLASTPEAKERLQNNNSFSQRYNESKNAQKSSPSQGRG